MTEAQKKWQKKDVTKFHGIGLTVEETEDVMRVIVSKAQRGSMPHRQHLSVQPRRRRGFCDWKEKDGNDWLGADGGVGR